MSTPYKTAIRTKGATFRLILTDHRGRVTERGAANPTEWLLLSNRLLNASRFDARNRDGRSSTERRQPRYVRCESICVLPSGEEVPAGQWTQSVAQEQARIEGPLVQVGERIARQALAAMDADLDAQTTPLIDPDRLAYARTLYRSSHEAVNQ